MNRSLNTHLMNLSSSMLMGLFGLGMSLNSSSLLLLSGNERLG